MYFDFNYLLENITRSHVNDALNCTFPLVVEWSRMSLSTAFSVKITKENENRFKEESVDIFRVKKAAKRSFLCKDRREFGLLQSTLGNLQKSSETRIKEYDDSKRDLEWILYNLRQEKAGKLGEVVRGESTLFKLSHMWIIYMGLLLQ